MKLNLGAFQWSTAKPFDRMISLKTKGVQRKVGKYKTEKQFDELV